MRPDPSLQSLQPTVGRNRAMTNSRCRTIGMAVAMMLVAAACTGGADGFEPGAPIPTDEPNATDENATSSTPDPTEPNTTAPSSAPASTTTIATSTTVAEPSTTSTTATAETTTVPPATETDPEPQLAPTPQAPSFDFPPADLETDPSSPNNNRVVEPEDGAVLDAYFEAALAQSEVFSTWPLDPDSPALNDAPFTDRVRDGFAGGLAARTELNQVLDVSGGSTSRPYVFDDDDGDPDRVIVWDCQIDATFWKDVDTGERAAPEPGGHPNAGPPGVEIGTATALVRRDGQWLVDEGGYEPRACSP